MIIERYCYIALAFSLLFRSGGQIAGPVTNANGENRTYRDERIQVPIPANWSSRPVYRSSGGAGSARDLIGVELSDGPFDLYLLTHYSQASGVKGGRFGEIADYVVPWLKSDEPESCLEAFKESLNRVSKEMLRVDLILDPKPKVRSRDPFCLAIQNQTKHRAWAGAYFASRRNTNVAPGFFINLPLGSNAITTNSQMVFAASFRTTNAGGLPVESDASLRAFLAEADRIVAGIKYR